MPPATLVGAGKALSELARRRHLGTQLRRAGGPQRVARALARGIPAGYAVQATAKITKGHAAELAQSIEFTVHAALAGARERARPNPRANDPLTDVHILRGTRPPRDGRKQLKVGSAAYVRRAASSGKYQAPGVELVANSEAIVELARAGVDVSDLVDRVSYAQSHAPQILAGESQVQATDGLVRCLSRRTTLTQVEQLVASARAGMHDGLFALAWGLGEAVATGRVYDDGWDRVVHEAISGAGRAAARSTLQTAIVLHGFNKKARAAYSAGLVRRMASSAVVAGAVAETIVESAIDFARMVRGEISRDDLLKNVVVHGTSAAGAAAGTLVMRTLFAGTAWWLQGLMMLLGAAGGAKAGRHAGQRLVGR